MPRIRAPVPQAVLRYQARRNNAARVQTRFHFARRRSVHDQVVRGRGDPSQPWCMDKSCRKEGQIFKNPFMYLVDNRNSRRGLPVKGYFKDFIDAMVGQLFPDILDRKARDRKSQGLLSFVDSPPVRTAFFKFSLSYRSRRMRCSKADFQTALIKARPVFQDLMFGVKTAARVRSVHSYIAPQQDDQISKKWTLHDFIVRFLVWAELCRQQKTPRSAGWVIGSRERVTEFLTAVLYNFWLMERDKCFDSAIAFKDDWWDRVWKEWLDKYPVEGSGEGSDEGDFQPRNKIDGLEEHVHESVGYLGGVGKRDDIYTPIRRALGDHEWLTMRNFT
ncbi:hypothetical protein ACJ41O_001023 [Fusarium nematophilum]